MGNLVTQVLVASVGIRALAVSVDFPVGQASAVSAAFRVIPVLVANQAIRDGRANLVIQALAVYLDILVLVV